MADFLTLGFDGEELLQTHFLKHKDEYGVTTREEYLALADRFIGGELKGYMRECRCTTDDDIVRYDKRSQDFGIINNGFIVTFYKLNKGTIQRNEAYFEKRCDECQAILTKN